MGRAESAIILILTRQQSERDRHSEEIAERAEEVLARFDKGKHRHERATKGLRRALEKYREREDGQ